MKKVCCEHLLPGMELAVDVKGADDSVFLAKGTVLSSEDIQGLTELGADWVKIVPAGKDEDLKDLARRCEEYVRQFYYYVDPGSSLFNDLYRATLEATMKRLMDEGDWVLPCGRELKAAAHQSRRDLFFQGEGGPEDIVNHEMELISFPDTYFKLQEILKSPKSSAANVAEVIKLDINLVTKLLRLVNSPAYGLPQKIDSIERAVAIIGVEGVSSLALGITAMPMFKDIPPDLMDVSSFWKHSISCAIFARDTGRSMGRDDEYFFTGGLLHDVGRLLLLKNMPEAYLQVLLHARDSFIPLVEAEEAILGYNHAQLGEVLLRRWGCPDKLIALVGGHHALGEQGQADAKVIQLADNLANAFAIASGWAYVLPGMEEQAWLSLGIKPQAVVDSFNRHGQALQEVVKSLV